MAEVICLANSRKEHERCVAGIDPDDREIDPSRVKN